jgi:hypothetical protein
MAAGYELAEAGHKHVPGRYGLCPRELSAEAPAFLTGEFEHRLALSSRAGFFPRAPVIFPRAPVIFPRAPVIFPRARVYPRARVGHGKEP